MIEPIKCNTQEEFNERCLKGGLFDVPYDWYHHSPGVRRSSLANILVSPAYYKYTEENPMKSSFDLEFGTCFHTAILENDKCNEVFVVGPDVRRNTKVWKAFAENHPDKILLKPDEFDTLNGMVESFHNNDLAMSFLNQATIERTAYATIDGLLCKARSDMLMFNRPIMADLKSAKDVSLKGFQKSSSNYGYHIQAAYYMDVFNAAMRGEHEIKQFLFLSEEKTPPYHVQTFVADPIFIDEGRADYKRALCTLSSCLKTGVFEGLPQEILNLTLPRWHK